MKFNVGMKMISIIGMLIVSVIGFKQWWEDSKVFELKEDNFFNIVGKDKYVFVKFYTRWCGYCRMMSDEYEKLFELAKEKRPDIIIGRLEGSLNEIISRTYRIHGFPRLVLFKPGDVAIDAVYEGKRTAEEMFKFIDQNTKTLDKKEELKLLDEIAEMDSVFERVQKEFEEIPEKAKQAAARIPKPTDNNQVKGADLTQFRDEMRSFHEKLEKLEKELNDIKAENIKIKEDSSSSIKVNPRNIIILIIFLLIIFAFIEVIRKFSSHSKKSRSDSTHEKV